MSFSLARLFRFRYLFGLARLFRFRYLFGLARLLQLNMLLSIPLSFSFRLPCLVCLKIRNTIRTPAFAYRANTGAWRQFHRSCDIM